MHIIHYSVVKQLPDLTQETIIKLKQLIAKDMAYDTMELCATYCTIQCPDGCTNGINCKDCIFHQPNKQEVELLTVKLFTLSL